MSAAGSGPGRTVRTRQIPSSFVELRAKPRNPGTELARAPRGSSRWSNRPSGSACQVSISASGTGSPAPSRTVPVIRNEPGVSVGTTSSPSGPQFSPIARNGPTVCDGVSPSRSLMVVVLLVLEHRGFRAAQDDVEVESERPLLQRRAVVVTGDHPVPGFLVAHRVEDRVLEEQRVVGEVHLGHQPLGERSSEQREVDVRRPPRVRVVLPWVGTRAHGDEPVPPLGVGHGPPDTGEVGVQRRRPVVPDVAVSPGGVGLPDLDQGVRNGTTVLLEDAAMHDDPLPLRLVIVLAGEVVVELADAILAQHRPGQLTEALRDEPERLLRVPQPGGRVLRAVGRAVNALVRHAVARQDEVCRVRHRPHPHASSTTANPWPTPMQIAASPYPPPRWRSCQASEVRIREPEDPSACPMAMAPPSGLRVAGSRSGHCARHASDCAAKASFSSTAVRSPQPIPARASAFSAASTGAAPKNCGSIPAAARDTTRARGFPPSRPTPASSASNSAEAPSFIGEELPAVTVPSGRNTGRRLANFSAVVSGRIDSSRSRSAPSTGSTSSS